MAETREPNPAAGDSPSQDPAEQARGNAPVGRGSVPPVQDQEQSAAMLHGETPNAAPTDGETGNRGDATTPSR